MQVTMRHGTVGWRRQVDYMTQVYRRCSRNSYLYSSIICALFMDSMDVYE